MTRAQAAILRLVLICAAWAVGQTLTWGLAMGPVGLVIPAALAIGVLVVTEDLGRPPATGGDLKYWRGRRVDDEERPGRRRVDDDERRGRRRVDDDERRGRWN